MRVFVVEDDRLVRKGFISLMPWEQYGMVIVGEAGNGEDALEFLKHHEVDLLITDVLMPKMGGIELIRVVRDQYPRIWSVILTFHQDFEFIQEALRLGAIDYIAKTELQQDKMEEVLGRIEGRIRYERGQQGFQPEPASLRSLDQALIWFAHPYIHPVGLGVSFLSRLQAEEIAAGIWMRAMDVAEIEEEVHRLPDSLQPDTFAVLRLSGIGSTDRGSVARVLQQYRERLLFYEWKGYASSVLCRSYDRLLRSLHDRPEAGAEELLRESWSSLQWVVNDRLYEENVAVLEHAKLSLPQLDALFAVAAARWERIVPGQTWTPAAEARSCWEGWKQWLEGLRRELMSRLFKPSYSQEVLSCVWKAVESILRDLSRGITLKDIAVEVNMSQSYLSQCFRDIVGLSFNDYVRQARMNWAKQLLADTNQPIYWIATQTGYPNEKYFSRVFKAKTGMLPSAYRTSVHVFD
ncbi:hypothetical protein AWU65_24380 [Paenibacillus glucanolyticus]|uniref:DNA-binding response regulator n=1 Tax=Paenibacillus glucanolyticus TaxID=59843 RepID=A0A163M8V9_9BACL|nr:response regulator [Paenibacillus glucanolyticus]KZS48848.1 hypothetical protein AWU65_24380 [Paenibacillus glucanolyticus]